MARRVYATPADLAEYLGLLDPPDDAQRLLLRASEEVDSTLMASVYAVDDTDHYPVVQEQRDACRDAVCAIVEWWAETGDETGASGAWTSASAGAVSLSRTGSASSGSTQVKAMQLPPRALGYLQRSGLLPGTVYQR